MRSGKVSREQLVSELIELLRRTGRAFQQNVYTALRGYDLTVPQMWVLRTLSLKGPLSLAELSRHVEMSTSNVSGIVDRLVRIELVNRTRDQADRRIVWLELSSNGHELVSRVPAMHEAYFTDMLQEMTDSDVQGLVMHLQSLVAIVEAHSKNSAVEVGPPEVGGRQA